MFFYKIKKACQNFDEPFLVYIYLIRLWYWGRCKTPITIAIVTGVLQQPRY